MSHQHKAQREDVEVVRPTAVVAGKRSLIADRYPALDQALGDRGSTTGEPTIHDAATLAVDHKGGGAALDPGVAARVGAHLGADFSGVRVHSDPLTQQATAAMGARAFAYGGDVFLGAGESASDVGLMAHELTHVAQQGGAGQRAIQRAVQVGDADSPAEREADQVSTAVTDGQARPSSLLVDGAPVGPGQMLKSQFLEQLRAEVTAAADAELGPIYSAIGCPYIDQYFGRYGGQSASSSEALLQRFAPATRTARAAADMIPAVVARVREGVRQWRDTGQAPPDLAAMAPGAGSSGGGAVAPTQAQMLRAPDGSETLASLEAELGPGGPLDGATAHRMSDALGVDVSSARIHTGPIAARKAAEAGALAFAVGANVVMAAGAPTAGTLEGDALLAHELAHTVQQADHARDPVARMQPLRSAGVGDLAHEANADAAAEAVVEHAHGASKASLWSRISTPLGLSRCTPSEDPADRAARFNAINTLMNNPEANASSIATEIAAVKNARDRARVVRQLAGTTADTFCTQVGNYEHGGVILTAMRDGIEPDVGDNVAERVGFADLRKTIDRAITARTASSATPSTGITNDLARLNTLLTPDFGLGDYTGGLAPIHLPAEVFPGEAAARVGHVYFDSTLPVASRTNPGAHGVTETALLSRAGVDHFFAGYIRLGPSLLLPGATAAFARSALHHEWTHYKMQVERNGTLTDPDLITIRTEIAAGKRAQAEGDEHALIIAGQVERDGDSISDPELQNLMEYLGENLAKATGHFVTIANDRVSRWALTGKPTGKPGQRRTPRQRRLVPAITRAGQPSLATLSTRVNVNLP